MHDRRSADPDTLEVRQGQELGPVPHRRCRWIMFATKIFRAFVCRIRDSDDLDFRMFLESRQMTSANDIARPNNPNPQFLIVFLHWLCAISILRARCAFVRAKFDRDVQWFVQLRKLSRVNIHLTRPSVRGSLRISSRDQLCQEFVVSQDLEPCAAALFTGAVWPRKKAAWVGMLRKMCRVFSRPICVASAFGCRN